MTALVDLEKVTGSPEVSIGSVVAKVLPVYKDSNNVPQNAAESATQMKLLQGRAHLLVEAVKRAEDVRKTKKKDQDNNA